MTDQQIIGSYSQRKIHRLTDNWFLFTERYTDQQIIGSYSQRKIDTGNWFLCIEKDRLTDDWLLVIEKD